MSLLKICTINILDDVERWARYPKFKNWESSRKNSFKKKIDPGYWTNSLNREFYLLQYSNIAHRFQKWGVDFSVFFGGLVYEAEYDLRSWWYSSCRILDIGNWDDLLIGFRHLSVLPSNWIHVNGKLWRIEDDSGSFQDWFRIFYGISHRKTTVEEFFQLLTLCE